METYSAAAACENATVISSIQLSPLLSFLIAVQTAALASLGGGPNFDPKFYVDLPLKYPLNVTTKAFQTLSSSSSQNTTIPPNAFQQFQNSYFDEPGSDLLAYTPADYTPTPANFVPGVQNQQVRKWALQIHALWLILARQTAAIVEKQPDQHTLLPVPQPFIIPGDRFREVYYWDSYWIIRGLLVSGMVDTAKGIVESLLALVEQYGFMPNGGRMYYENRSQPPLLSMMILAIFKHVQDPSLLKTALPVLLQEHTFWTTDPHIVLVEDSGCNVHQLSRYWARWDSPRPESSTTDTNVTAGLSTSRQKQVYHDIATAAESGWDFSSRWMQDQEHLTTLRTSSIIPVDLNSFLFQMEVNIAFFAKVVGDIETSRNFSVFAKSRKKAIQSILWNAKRGQWFDYWLPACSKKGGIYPWNEESQNKHAFASNFIPLWCGVLAPRDKKIGKVIAALNSSGLLLAAGIATSLRETGQQWDFPNAWPPLQHMIIEGLASTKSHQGKTMAMSIARRWLSSNYASFQAVGKMIEKYNAQYCGQEGFGGEYNPQTGFGWTNGVVLSLLQEYGWPADLPIGCS